MTTENQDIWTCPNCKRTTESANSLCDDCVFRPTEKFTTLASGSYKDWVLIEDTTNKIVLAFCEKSFHEAAYFNGRLAYESQDEILASQIAKISKGHPVRISTWIVDLQSEGGPCGWPDSLELLEHYRLYEWHELHSFAAGDFVVPTGRDSVLNVGKVYRIDSVLEHAITLCELDVSGLGFPKSLFRHATQAEIRSAT